MDAVAWARSEATLKTWPDGDDGHSQAPGGADGQQLTDSHDRFWYTDVSRTSWFRSSMPVHGFGNGLDSTADDRTLELQHVQLPAKSD